MTVEATGLPRNPDRRAPDIPALTGIRGIAAGWVVLKHLNFLLLGLFPAAIPLSPLVDGGHLGVDVFFVLSGFVISHNYAHRLRRFDLGTYRDFLWARVARIYPVHLVTLLVAAALVVAGSRMGAEWAADPVHSVPNFFANLFMVHAATIHPSFNRVAWSVGCEMAAYVAFPLLALAVVRLSRRSALGCAAAVLLAGVLAANVLTGELTTSPAWWVRIGVGFTTGCLLWAWWQSGVSGSRWWDVTAVVAAIGMGAVLYAVPMGSPRVLLGMPFAALLVLCCASAAGPVRQLLSSRWMQWGGRVSYSLYMTHFLLIMILNKLMPMKVIAAAPFPVRIGAFVGYVGVIVLVAAGTYRLVEEPGRRLVRRGVARRVDASA